ncbi:MAG: CRTAC1 family protein, partial [Planctomycetota bacterium]
LNQDGWQDLLICNFGINVSFLNQGDGTFRAGKLEPSNDSFWTSSIAIADFNQDSLPDFFEANYVDDPALFETPPRDANGRYSVFRGPESYRAAVDRVFFADPSFGYRAVPLQTRDNASPALGVVAGNFDTDESVDVYVANDMRPNHYWTHANGTFHDLAQLRGCAFGRQGGAGASMGIATGDFDGNGHIDFHVTNFLNEPVHHFLQTDTGVFLDGVLSANLYAPTMPVLGFGTTAADIDNDCDDDLLVLNGHIEDLQFRGADFKMQPQCFLNSRGSFQVISGDVLGGFFQKKTLGRGLASLDWNKDGRVDFVANHLDRPADLVENATETPYSWIQLRLVGTSCERSSVGAAVTLRADNKAIRKWRVSGSGYSSHDEAILHFGLGNDVASADIAVEWSDGSEQHFNQIPARHRFLIVQGEDDVWSLESR